MFVSKINIILSNNVFIDEYERLSKILNYIFFFVRLYYYICIVYTCSFWSKYFFWLPIIILYFYVHVFMIRLIIKSLYRYGKVSMILNSKISTVYNDYRKNVSVTFLIRTMDRYLNKVQ